MPKLSFWAASLGLTFSGSALAFGFSWGDIDGNVDVLLSAGATWRAENIDPALVGKRSNMVLGDGQQQLCPDAQNGGPADLVSDILGGCVLDAAEHQAFVDAPGAFTQNGDNGNLNYQKGDVVHAAFKSTIDFGLSWENIGLRGRTISFYDPTSVDYQESHPDAVFQPLSTMRSKEVEDEIGFSNSLESFYISSDWDVFDRTLSVSYGKQIVSWGESLTFVVNSVNSINAPSLIRLNTPGGDLSEIFIPTELARVSMDLTENLAFDAFYQTKRAEVGLPPVGDFFSTADVAGAGASYAMLSFGKEPEDPSNLQDLGDYPGQDAARQAYLDREGQCGGVATSATTDSNGNTYDADMLAKFGPYKANVMDGDTHGKNGRTLCLANTQHARDDGQYGLKLGYYAAWLNDTELGFYYTRTHSRLPYASLIASEETNLEFQPAGAPINTGVGTIDGLLTLLGGVAGTVLALPTNGASATPEEIALGTVFSTLFSVNTDPTVNIEADDAAVIGALAKVDTASLFLEYPEDIDMYGMSFNTTVGDYSLSGEVAYRPKMPVQIAPTDLTLYALSPAFGTSRDVAARSFYESYLSGQPYKTYWDGGEDASGYQYTPTDEFRATPGQVIHGYLELPVANYSLTTLYSTGQNPFGADAVIFVGDVGATQVWDMPSKDVLQLSAPGDDNHAGIGRAQQDAAIDNGGSACNTSSNVLVQAVGSPIAGLLNDPVAMLTALVGNAQAVDFTCVPGVLNQTPTQEAASTFADSFSWGARVLSIWTYNNLIFGATLNQTLGAFIDINGNSPGPGGNFVEGRKRFLWGSEFVKGDWAMNVKYNWFTGAGDRNLEGDRDHYSLDVRYSF